MPIWIRIETEGRGMGDTYRQLSTLFHMDTNAGMETNLEHAAREQLESDSTFRTGIITRLSELFIAMPRELTIKLNDVLIQDQSVALLWSRLPQIMKRNYIDRAIGDEILSTNEIEGVRSTRKEVQLAVAAAHFLFEYTHPFHDGNGRTGRFLLALNLQSALATPTILPLSRVIAHNRPKYYKAFMQVEDELNHGELTFFVMMLLDLIMESQRDLIEYLVQLMNGVEGLRHRCDQLMDMRAPPHAGDVLFVLMQEQKFGGWRSLTLDDAAHYLGLSKQSARKVVKELEQAGLIEYTKRRPLMFRFSGDGVDSADSPEEMPEI